MRLPFRVAAPTFKASTSLNMNADEVQVNLAVLHGMSAAKSETPSEVPKVEDTEDKAPNALNSQTLLPPPNDGAFAWLQCLNTFLL